MAKTRKVDRQAYEDLIKRTTLPAVGATVAHPDLFPTELGVGRRTEPRNEYLGAFLTRPEEDKVVFGLNYFDRADVGDNEDMYMFDTTTGELKPYMRGSFEREYPEYFGHHWAQKQYLRKPPSD